MTKLIDGRINYRAGGLYHGDKVTVVPQVFFYLYIGQLIGMGLFKIV